MREKDYFVWKDCKLKLTLKRTVSRIVVSICYNLKNEKTVLNNLGKLCIKNYYVI